MFSPKKLLRLENHSKVANAHINGYLHIFKITKGFYIIIKETVFLRLQA